MQQSKQITAHSYGFKRLVLLNRYYKITKFYSFLGQTALKGGIAFLLFGALILGLELFLVDFKSLFNSLVEISTPAKVFSFFLLSETTIGIILPEALIAWAAQSTTPWLLTLALATTSYIGGILAYLIGNRLHLVPALRNYLENKASIHIKNLRRWGGLFIFVGAVSPVPHALVSMASGLIRYNFGHYLLWALFRYVRFVFYAIIIFQIF